MKRSGNKITKDKTVFPPRTLLLLLSYYKHLIAALQPMSNVILQWIIMLHKRNLRIFRSYFRITTVKDSCCPGTNKVAAMQPEP